MSKKDGYKLVGREKEYFREYYQEHKEDYKKNYTNFIEDKEGKYVYLILNLNEGKSFRYVGSTENIYARIANHKSKGVIKSIKEDFFAKEGVEPSIAVFVLDLSDTDITKEQLLALEMLYIEHYQTLSSAENKELDKYYRIMTEILHYRVWENGFKFKLYYKDIVKNDEKAEKRLKLYINGFNDTKGYTYPISLRQHEDENRELLELHYKNLKEEEMY